MASIAFSKRKVSEEDSLTGGTEPSVLAAVNASIGAPNAVEALENGGDVMNGSPDETLKAAIDRWIFDLGHEEHELRDRLIQVRRQLEEKT